MHLLLTDRLTCPRCGPAFGLILRADGMEDRRVHRGGLGCPNCREVYPVEDGVGDLRPPPRVDPIPGAEGSAGDRGPSGTEGAARPKGGTDANVDPDDDEALKAHALLGVMEGPGEVLLLDAATRFGPALVERIPEVEVVGAGSWAPAWPRTPRLSRMRTGDRLPFGHRVFRGVLLEGPVPRSLLREAARVLAPDHRVVVLDAPAGTAEILMAAGLTVKLDQDGVVVAGR